MSTFEIRPWHCVAVLASYNEAQSIAAVLAELKEAALVLEPSGVTLTVVLVDDASPDGTAEIATRWAAQLGLDIDIIDGPQAGLGRAIFEGMRRALVHEPDSIVTLDADGQHNPTYVPTLHRAFLARRADLLIGSRWVRGGTSPGTSLGRTVGSRVGNRIFRAVSGVRHVKDATTSFRIYSPELVRYLMAAPSQRFDGYSFFSTIVALADAAGFVISEVPISFRPRYSGTSKFGFQSAWQFFRSLPELRGDRRVGRFAGDEEDYKAKDELHVLNKATRWNDFIVERLVAGFRAGEVQEILEVGSGIGGITAKLRERFPDAGLTCLEPDPVNRAEFEARFAHDADVTVLADTVEHFRTSESGIRSFDLIVYVNVLEHIRDDLGEIQAAAKMLDSGGRITILVPALPGLYGPIDFKSGHFRRYTTADVTDILLAAGLRPERVEYFDPIGVAPYWVNYRLLNKAGISTRGVWTFDNLVVPLMRLSHRSSRPWPFGKNVIAVGTKP